MNRWYIVFAVILTLISPVNLGTGVNYGVYLLFILTFFLFILQKKKNIVIPPRYNRLLLLFWGCMFLNALVSKYTPAPQFVLLGMLITSLPFFHYIISYNYKFSLPDIRTLVRVIICCTLLLCILVLIESLINGFLDGVSGIWNPKYLLLGFVASSCNQALLFSLFLYHQTKEKKYLRFACVFIVFVLASLQLKAITGTVIVLLGYYFFFHSHKGIYLKLGLIGALLIGLLFVIPAFRDKLNMYVGIYTVEGASTGVARNALYFTAGQIAVDHFPLGTGQGTYASVASKFTPDCVMADYGINKVYGLDEDNVTEGDFRLDTHWANILGENGILGSILYLMLFFYPIRECRKKKNYFTKDFSFVITTSIFCIFIESFALPLPNRLNFIFIYTGLMAILVKYSYSNPPKELFR